MGGGLFLPLSAFFAIEILWRWGSLLDDEEPGLGFCEWIARLLRAFGWLRDALRKPDE